MHVLLEKPDRSRGFKKERILRVLLNHSDGDITKYRVAKEAETTEAWTREYTDRLEDNGLLEDTTVVDPRGLYGEWQTVRIDPTRVQVSLQQPMELLGETDLQYATTTYTAENLYQGFLFDSMTDLYVHPEESEQWLEIIETRGGIGGGNTRLQVTDEHVFYEQQRIQGLTAVSIPQLILDLLDEGGPCEEAAERLIDRFHGTTDG